MPDKTPGTWMLLALTIILTALLAYHVNQIATATFDHVQTVLTETPKGETR